MELCHCCARAVENIKATNGFPWIPVDSACTLILPWYAPAMPYQQRTVRQMLPSVLVVLFVSWLSMAGWLRRR